MTLYTLRRTQLLPGSPAEVFPFFERPENLSRIVPSWLRFRILTPSPVAMSVGTLIDYTIRWLAFSMRWRTLITTHRSPERFVDVQILGPYSYWHHSHRFSAVEGGTRMEDEVVYAVPGGFAGRILHGLLIRRQLEAIFDHRARAIEAVFREEGEERE